MWHRGASPANAAVIAFDDSPRNTPIIVFGRRATSPAACANAVIAFDAHRRLACPIEVAHTILDGADAIRHWFGVTAVGPRRPSAEHRDRLSKAVPLLLHRGLDLLASELDAR